MDIKTKISLLFLLGGWCGAGLATAPGVCIRGNCLIDPSGGLIFGPIKPKTQMVSENPEPYGLAPAPSNFSSVGKVAFVEQKPLTQAIFVGPSWQHAAYNVAGMDSFLSGWDGSSYAKALSEYVPRSQGAIYYAGFSFLDAATGRVDSNEIVEAVAPKTKGYDAFHAEIVARVMLGLRTGRYQAALDGQ